VNYLVCFAYSKGFGNMTFKLERLDDMALRYIRSEIKKECGEDVAIISITRLEG